MDSGIYEVIDGCNNGGTYIGGISNGAYNSTTNGFHLILAGNGSSLIMMASRLLRKCIPAITEAFTVDGIFAYGIDGFCENYNGVCSENRDGTININKIIIYDIETISLPLQ